MILDNDGQKTTPKKLASDILLDGINIRIDFWGLEDDVFEKMTEREVELVGDQIRKLSNRMAKAIGRKTYY